MRILLLTPQLPYPPEQGTSLRNFHILKGLAERHEVTLLSFGSFEEEPKAEAVLGELCQDIRVVAEPVRGTGLRLRRLVTDRRPDMAHRLQSAAFDDALAGLLEAVNFEVVQVEGIELARIMPVVREISPQSMLVFDDHNAEAELQRRAMLTDLGQPSRWVAALYSLVQVGRLRRFERWACNTADAVTAVSDTDAGHIRNLGVKSPVRVIPNCLDVLELQAKLKQSGRKFGYDLVFSGKMDYRPNIDAVLWFADEIWPVVKAKRPQATWAIVGQKPHARLERLKQMEGVTVTGWVEAIWPYLAGAGIFVMPFRMGSGTRLKLIEAMAAGKAIVSTRIGAEGFPVTDFKELLLADDPVRFANSILTLLSSGEMRRKLGAEAAEFARAYDWREVIPKFERLYTSIGTSEQE